LPVFILVGTGDTNIAIRDQRTLLSRKGESILNDWPAQEVSYSGGIAANIPVATNTNVHAVGGVSAFDQFGELSRPEVQQIGDDKSVDHLNLLLAKV